MRWARVWFTVAIKYDRLWVFRGTGIYHICFRAEDGKKQALCSIVLLDRKRGLIGCEILLGLYAPKDLNRIGVILADWIPFTLPRSYIDDRKWAGWVD